MCIDYTRINPLLVRPAQPLPTVDSMFVKLSGCKIFAALDFRQGFHQNRLTKSSRPLTAFITPFGLFEYSVMPFGLNTAPIAFQNNMQHAFHDLIENGSCQIYIDDLLIAAKTEK
ncbi:reverse transcriptase, partial [Aduncisulcus paluster]